MKNYLVLIALAVLMASGCSSTGGNESSGICIKSGIREVEVKAGAESRIEFAAKLSTGFSWKLVYPLPQGVTITGESVKTSGVNKTGADDVQVFTLRASKGEFILTFRYGEHWKSNPQYVDTCTVKIIAK